MLAKPFGWKVPHDENRAADGFDLRHEFCREQGLEDEALASLGAVSFLEVLVGLSRRMEFIAGGSASYWGMQFLENLELHKMTDPLSSRKRNQAKHILNVCIKREYGPDGVGGFFPLAWPDRDQRELEIWYQMSAYIDEQSTEH